MKRPIIAAAILALLLPATATAVDPPAPTTGTPYAGPCRPAESQAWWSKTPIVIPSNVGQHIHVATCIPTTAVDGTLVLQVTVTQHNGTGAIKWIRACRESSYCQRWSVSLGPCADCSATYYLPLNVGSWPTGRQELRLTANVSSNADGKRQFQSDGWPVNVRAISPCPRCSTFWTARGWYTDRGYQNAELESEPSSIRAGGSVNVYLHPGADGLPTTFSGVFVDPRFHDGDAGIVVKTVLGPFRGSVTLPTLSAGVHRLVLVASDGFNAGVLAFPFTVAP